MDDIKSILKVALKLAIERIVSETVSGDKPLDHYTGMLAGANEMLTCALATLDAIKIAPPVAAPIRVPARSDDELQHTLWSSTIAGCAVTLNHIEAGQFLALLKTAAPAAPIAEVTRTKLNTMQNDNGEIGWYFDCDSHYIDVERDKDGKYSVFFRNRNDGTEAWLDQAEHAKPEPVAPSKPAQQAARAAAEYISDQALANGGDPLPGGEHADHS